MNTPIPAMPEADAVLGNLADAAETKLSLGRVLRSLFLEFGGPTGFAQTVKLDFDALDPGAATRVKIETDMIRALGSFDGEVDELPADRESLVALAHQLMERATKTNDV